MTDPVQHYDIPEDRCPTCSESLECACSADGENQPPSPGDYTFCFRCGASLRFDDQMKHRPLNKEDWAEIRDDPDMLLMMAKASAGVRAAIEKRKRGD